MGMEFLATIIAMMLVVVAILMIKVIILIVWMYNKIKDYLNEKEL